MNQELLIDCEEFIARHNPDKSVEEVFVEMQRVLKVHKKFNQYIRKNNITISMPKKSEAILERRKLFVNWYVQQNQDKYLQEVIEELTTLVFASETTITNIIYNYI